MQVKIFIFSSSTKLANLKRTRVSKFDEAELPFFESEDYYDDDDDYDDLDDVPLPEMPATRDGRDIFTRGLNSNRFLLNALKKL